MAAFACHLCEDALTKEAPCIAAVASVKRELGGKWAAIMVLNQCVTAWLCALVMRLILLAI